MRSLGLLLLAAGCVPHPPPILGNPEPPAAAEPPREPDGASDWLRRGLSYMKLADSGHKDAYEQAKDAFGKCVERDPELADCYFHLGEADELRDDETGAAHAYTIAVMHAPASPDYYEPLAATYLRFKLYPQAEQVLSEGVRRIPHELVNAARLLRLYRMLAIAADSRGDREAKVAALEAGAREAGSDAELDFELGTAYAELEPPRVDDALHSLGRFTERVCSGAGSSMYALECASAATAMHHLTNASGASNAPSGSVTAPSGSANAPSSSVTAPSGSANSPSVSANSLVPTSERNPTPTVAPSGPPALPPVPDLTLRPMKSGDAFTVWGASYSLRSRSHRRDVVREGTDRSIWITGYIVKTNLGEAPKCAVHSPGRADPPGCARPLPTYWLGDTKDAPLGDCIRVVGWASNYAQIYEAIRAFDRHSPDQYIDGFWGVSVPNPLPAAGAKVNVRGTYGPTFTLSSSGIEVDPQMGLLTYQSSQVLEAAPELETLPGVTRKVRH